MEMRQPFFGQRVERECRASRHRECRRLAARSCLRCVVGIDALGRRQQFAREPEFALLVVLRHHGVHGRLEVPEDLDLASHLPCCVGQTHRPDPSVRIASQTRTAGSQKPRTIRTAELTSMLTPKNALLPINTVAVTASVPGRHRSVLTRVSRNELRPTWSGSSARLAGGCRRRWSRSFRA